MTDSHEYEVVVVGGGPAGLSAARTAARLGFRTLVLERLAGPGDSAHPCSGVIAPVPGFVSGQRREDGLYFPELDLLVPPSLIRGFPPLQRYTSPSGYEFQVPFTRADDFPVAAIDRPGLLQILAGQAMTAGAELRFGTAAIGLLQEGNRIVGVRTARGDIRAEIVLSAEGTARQMVEEAGFFAGQPPAQRYAFIVSQEMSAPGVGPENLGQIVTLGKRFTSAPDGFGTVVLPAPGRASVYFTAFTDQPRGYTVQSAWSYLDEYVERDPRVCALFRGARILSRSGYRMLVRGAPGQVVRDGLMGIGDAITPGGHLGILPAVYTGRQAALIAAEAIDAGDCSAPRIAPYARLFYGPLLHSLEREGRLVMGMTGMADDEIDRLCQTLQTLHLATPYLSNWRTIAWETVGWVLRQFPLIARDWDLLQRMLRQGDGQTLEGPMTPLPLNSSVPIQPGAISVPLRMQVMS